MNIGDKIRTLRKSKKLTQEQLAEYLQISSQAVSKWETGISCPDIDMLPKLAVFFSVSVDELLDFDQQKINEEVDALVSQSVPLREKPEKAEEFYRKALEKYPNNEVLLNCLLMTIPNDRSLEKIKIGEHLLECTTDAEIKYDALRIMALTYSNMEEKAMAEYYLSKIPELYFLKTEIAAAIKNSAEKMKEIRKTEDVCLRTLTAMLAMRVQTEETEKGKDNYRKFAYALLDLYQNFDSQKEHSIKLKAMFDDETILDFYR